MSRRSWLTALVLALALVAGLAGCGGGNDSGPHPPSASGTTDTPSSGGSDAAADDAKLLFKAAVKPLLDGKVIDFEHDVYSGEGLAIDTRGEAFQQAGWEATTVSPKVVSSSTPPTGADIKGTMQVRAVGDDLFLQLSTWGPPLAGCWLRTGDGQVPGGLLAMTPGVPGYITLLGVLRPVAFAQQGEDGAVIAATAPLRIGLQLLTTGVLGLLGLDAGQLSGATVPLQVEVADGVLASVTLVGADLISAVRSAGGDVSADAEATVGQLHVTVGYQLGDAQATPVVAPDAGQVMSNADVSAGRGC